MYYELYIDVLFLENFLLDYLLLSLLAKLLRCRAKGLRRACGAALGSFCVCLVYLLALERKPVGYVLIYGVSSVLMVCVGLKIRERRRLGKAVALLYFCGVLLGGLFAWLKVRIAFPVYPFLGISLISFCLLSVGMRMLMEFRGREQNLYEGMLLFRGKRVPVRVLRDTGNALRDPIFGKPVSIVTEEVQKAICQEDEVLYYTVPFHSIGQKNGMLQAFFADALYLNQKDGTVKCCERPLLGITKEPLSSKEKYDIILHPDLLG